METFKSFAEKLFHEKSVAVFCHVRPDGDAVGSSFALIFALKSKGIRADLFCDDDIPSRLNYLGDLVSKKQITEKYSAYLAVDCASIDRLGSFSKEFSVFNNTYNLDHHVSNDRFAKYNLITSSAANAENAFNVIKEGGANVTPEIANFLALGIVTDTGNFKHNNVTPETFLVASKLLGFGADFNKTVYYNFTAQSKERAKLFGLCMSKIRYYLNGRLAVLVISDSAIKESFAKPEETEGFIDFIMGIKGVEVGVSVMETANNSYKISFRSKGVNVNEVAEVFGGGGHELASGCRISGLLEDVIDRVRYAVSQHLQD